MPLGCWRCSLISIHALRGEGDSEVKEKLSIFKRFQSTPSVGRATRQVLRMILDRGKISIHALRGEGDVGRGQSNSGRGNISIHALRGEGDVGENVGLVERIISIHALRGEGDYEVGKKYGLPAPISIHALRGEGDSLSANSSGLCLSFQSTPSVGRATMLRKLSFDSLFISIHALRGEGD